MGQSKAPHRKKRRTSLKQTPWLPVVAVGAVILIVAAIAIFSQGDNGKPGGKGSSAFDASFTPEVSGAPRVMVTQDNIDYGDVKLGNTVKTVFEVRNVGDQPLSILGEPIVELVEGC